MRVKLAFVLWQKYNRKIVLVTSCSIPQQSMVEFFLSFFQKNSKTGVVIETCITLRWTKTYNLLRFTQKSRSTRPPEKREKLLSEEWEFVNHTNIKYGASKRIYTQYTPEHLYPQTIFGIHNERQSHVSSVWNTWIWMSTFSLSIHENCTVIHHFSPAKRCRSGRKMLHHDFTLSKRL